MKNAGFHSSRSPSGICIQKLAEITGASLQICRRYIRGEALPDYEKILKIANDLNVSPGSLLFGKLNELDAKKNDSILIKEDVLRHFLRKIDEFSPFLFKKLDNTPEFLMELITNVSAIDISCEQLKKIIDLAFNSTRKFSNHP